MAASKEPLTLKSVPLGGAKNQQEMEQIIASIDRRALERPKKRSGKKFEAAGDPWHGPPAAGPEFSEKVKEATKRRESEKGALSKWLRNGQIGGTKALAKELNRSISYVEGRLRGFETTRGVNRWTGPTGPTRFDTIASKATNNKSTSSSVANSNTLRSTRVAGGDAPKLPNAVMTMTKSEAAAVQGLSQSRASMAAALPPSASMVGSVLPAPPVAA